MVSSNESSFMAARRALMKENLWACKESLKKPERKQTSSLGACSDMLKESRWMQPCPGAACLWKCEHLPWVPCGPSSVPGVQSAQLHRSAAQGCSTSLLLLRIVNGTCACKLQGQCGTNHPFEYVTFGPSNCPDHILIVKWACNDADSSLDVYLWRHLNQSSLVGQDVSLRYVDGRIYKPIFQLSMSSNNTGHLAQTSFYHRYRDSDEAVKTYAKWLRNCQDAHPNCSSTDDDFLPTRLLDLSAASSDGDLKLVSSGGLSAAYVAFSYCWGGYQPPMTTHANFESRTDRIAYVSLPKCYKDVVRLVRKMGLRYVWIDSLCIIQDNEQDWAFEASQMGRTYANAQFTVIAASAANIEQGFLQNENDFCPWIDITIPSYDFDVRLRESGFQSLHKGQDACYEMPIALRGWTFQERLMSQRRLIFRDIEAVWECREGCICECSEVQCSYNPTLPTDPENPYKKWRTLVQEFSRRGLTVASDGLPAMSALAKLFFKTTRTDYLAGHWKQDLVKQLIWLPSHARVLYENNRSRRIMHDPSARPYSYVAPSWSWPSFPLGVVYDISTKMLWLGEDMNQGYSSEAEVVDAQCSPKYRDPFGAVSAGYIILNAMVCNGGMALTKGPYDRSSKNRRWRITLDTGFLLWLGCTALLDWQVIPIRTKTALGEIVTLQIQEAESRAPPSQQTDCGGDVAIAHISAGQYLVLAYSQREFGCYERLGLMRFNDFARAQYFDDPGIEGMHAQISRAARWSVVKII